MDFDGDRSADWEILLQGVTSSNLLPSHFILPPEKISSSALVGHLIQPMLREVLLLVLQRLIVAILVLATQTFLGLSVMVLWRTLAHVTVVIMPGRELGQIQTLTG